MTLSLRQAAVDDLGYLAALAADPQVEPFLSFAAADEDSLLALLSAPGPAPDSSGLVVIESPDGEPLGGMALTVVNARSRICDISRVMVSPESRRSGVALTAVRLACRHALHDHGMHRIQAECYGDNPTAHRLFERAGFTREGVRRRAYRRRGGWLDGVLFGLLADELSPQAPQASRKTGYV